MTEITDAMLARYTEMVRASHYPKTGPNAYKGIRPRGDRADYDRLRGEGGA
jgi:hypothetical protein